MKTTLVFFLLVLLFCISKEHSPGEKVREARALRQIVLNSVPNVVTPVSSNLKSRIMIELPAGRFANPFKQIVDLASLQNVIIICLVRIPITQEAMIEGTKPTFAILRLTSQIVLTIKDNSIFLQSIISLCPGSKIQFAKLQLNISPCTS